MSNMLGNEPPTGKRWTWSALSFDQVWAEYLMDRSLAHSPPGTAERKQYNHQLIRSGKMQKMQCQLSLNNVHRPSRKTPLKVGLVR
jgi:hypothetical protein